MQAGIGAPVRETAVQETEHFTDILPGHRFVAAVGQQFQPCGGMSDTNEFQRVLRSFKSVVLCVIAHNAFRAFEGVKNPGIKTLGDGAFSILKDIATSS